MYFGYSFLFLRNRIDKVMVSVYDHIIYLKAEKVYPFQLYVCIYVTPPPCATERDRQRFQGRQNYEKNIKL